MSDTFTGMSATDEWVLLAYRVPREPSTPRIAVWRKLRRLGAVQLLDGLVALPYDARTKEHLEWIADEVVDAGGEAHIWLARPATKAQARTMAAQMADGAHTEYEAIVDEVAEAIEGGGSHQRTVARLRRDLKRIRQRDYFPKNGFERAAAAIDRLDSMIESSESTHEQAQP